MPGDGGTDPEHKEFLLSSVSCFEKTANYDLKSLVKNWEWRPK